MTSTEDILKAMAAEKHKIMASAIKPQLQPNLTAADIVKAHRGGQKIGADSRLGSPQSSADLSQLPKVDFHIPGLKEMLKNDRR